MAIQKYDMRTPTAHGIRFEERFRSALDTPVLNAEGDVVHILLAWGRRWMATNWRPECAPAPEGASARFKRTRGCKDRAFAPH